MSQASDGSGQSTSYPAGVVQRTVIDGEMPALIVIHDDEDDWLIGDGVNDPNQDNACGVVHIGHIVDMDPSIREALDLPIGYSASRSTATSPWRVSRWQYED